MQGQLDPRLSDRPGEPGTCPGRPRPLVPKGGRPVDVLSRHPGLIGARCSKLRILSNESKTALSSRPCTNICHRNSLGASGSGGMSFVLATHWHCPSRPDQQAAGRRPAPACTQCPVVSSNPLPRGKKKTRPAEWVILPRLPAGAVAGAPAARALRWVITEVQPDELDAGWLHRCVHCVSRAGPGGVSVSGPLRQECSGRHSLRAWLPAGPRPQQGAS